MIKFRFWGVRGSVPSGSPDTAKFGGNTTCLEVRCDNELLIFDSGTGIRYLGNELMKSLPIKGKIFYSHVHWDHIQGLPFFTPLYVPGNEFQIYGGSCMPVTIEETLKKQMTAPCFPVPMDIMGAKIGFYDIAPGDIVEGDNYKVTLASQNHPNNSFAYRVDCNNQSIVFATDTEHYEDKLDENLVELSKGADYLIYDSQYTADEYYGLNGQMSRKTWGHSTAEEGLKLVEAAGVKNFVLFHHDPTHNDEFICKLEREAKEVFPNSIAAYEGLEIEVGKPIPDSLFA